MGKIKERLAPLLERGGEQLSDIFESPALPWKALFAIRVLAFLWILGTYIWECIMVCVSVLVV